MRKRISPSYQKKYHDAVIWVDGNEVNKTVWGLHILQILGCLFVTGTIRTYPMEYLDVFLEVTPLHLYIQLQVRKASFWEYQRGGELPKLKEDFVESERVSWF